MRRREFIVLISGVTVGCPRVTWAQQTAMPVIGFLSSRSPSESSALIHSFRNGLRQMGSVEGQNVNIAFRWADGLYERLPALASELVDLPVAVLFAAGGTPTALAAKAATSTIPVVFLATDPVGQGLVASLSHPGGNVTGISNMASDLPSKSTELLKQLMPGASVIAYLVNPTNPSAASHARQASAAAGALGVELRVIDAETSQELADAFAELAKRRIVALGVMADAFLDSQRERIVALSVQNGIAGCYPWRDYVLAGGMMSYGTNLSESYRQAGIYVGRVLHGEKPSNLPVMQPTKIELVLNLKPAKSLGITVTPTLLAIADEVIE
jgi:putative tryptophan/tyrosine transport system substrate-binding protein